MTTEDDYAIYGQTLLIESAGKKRRSLDGKEDVGEGGSIVQPGV
jgi:hypothetical protein